jgi:multidrug resistance efflux pump
MNHLIANLADCSEFRLALLARPPRIVHGTVVLLTTLLGSALAWAALTRADLVVRTAGRVRPVSTPKKVVNAVRGEVVSASVGGRVVEVNFREGDKVRRGDVLVRLDAERLDNEVSKRKRTIQAGEEELVQLARLDGLLVRQIAATKAKAEAELAQAEAEVKQAQDRQVLDVRLAQVEMDSAADEHGRIARLAVRRAVAETEVIKARTRLDEGREKLRKARLPVDDGRVRILREAVVLAERDAAMKREELAMKRGIKQGEVDTARIELANLELERKHALLKAPLDGVVTQGDIKVGDVLETGKAVLEIAEQGGFRFEAAVPSEEVARLRVGMPARIKLDAYDYQKYGTLAGTVCFISPDSGVPEGGKAVVYLVKIEVEGDAIGRGEFHGPVKLGMGGQAEIVTDQESLLYLLVKKIRQTISLG